MHLKPPVLSMTLLGLALAAWVSPSPAQETPPGMTRVSPGKSTRVFVMAAFDDSCKPLAAPSIEVTISPRKGTVVFREGQTTTIMSSLSGKCIGERVQGTGIYYTASESGAGEDAFEITARLATGALSTRSFKMFISD